MDRPAHTNRGNSAAVVLDPIINGFHLTRVLMDGGSSLNLLYQDTVRKMGIDLSIIKPTQTTFKGIIPGVEAHCTGSIALEVVFGSPDNYRIEELTFDIIPFHSDIRHCSDEPRLLDSTRCHIMPTISSRCPFRAALSRLMAGPNSSLPKNLPPL